MKKEISLNIPEDPENAHMTPGLGTYLNLGRAD